MRHVKVYGLVAILAITALALANAPSALAESTSLCLEDAQVAVCPEGQRANQIHLIDPAMKILAGTITVQCEALLAGPIKSPNNLGEPLEVEGEFVYTNCRAGATVCTVLEVNEEPEFAPVLILKTGVELGLVESAAEIYVECGMFIKCLYNHEGLSGHALGGLLSLPASEGGMEKLHITYTEQVLKKIGVGFICPNVAKLDALFVSLERLYIRK
jgi:hypothetical protein